MPNVRPSATFGQESVQLDGGDALVRIQLARDLDVVFQAVAGDVHEHLRGHLAYERDLLLHESPQAHVRQSDGVAAARRAPRRYGGGSFPGRSRSVTLLVVKPPKLR